MPIDYSKAYYKTWTNSAGWNLRLEVHPANSLASSGVHTSDYEELATGVISVKSSKWSFKDNQAGVPDAPTLGVEFDFGALPSNLQEALLSPQATTISGGADVAYLNGTGDANIPVTNTVYLYSNRGDAGSGVATSALTVAGLGYSTANNASYTTTGSGIGGTLNIVAPYNGVDTYTLLSGGTGYTTGTVTTFGGTGTGCMVDMTASGGVVTSIDSVRSGGIGYTVGDILTLNTGSANATFSVDSVTGDGHIVSYTFTGGRGFIAGDKIYPAGGDGNAYITVSTVTPEPRYIEFVGAQSTDFGGKIGIDADGNLTGKCELTFFDLFKTMCENTPASWFATSVFANKYYRDNHSNTLPTGTACAADTMIQYATVFYDVAVHDGSYNVCTVNQDVCDQGKSTNYTAAIMSLSKCFGVMQLLLRSLAPCWLRGTYLRTGTLTGTNSPISHLTFYKQNYDSDHKRGSSLSEDNIGFIAALVLGDGTGNPKNPTTWANPTVGVANDRLAGMLVEDKNGETMITGTLWDLLNDITKNFGCKLQWSYDAHKDATDLYSIDISYRFSPLLMAGVGAGTVPLDDMTIRDEGDWYDYQPAYNVVTNHSAEARNITAADRNQFQATNDTGKGKSRTSSQLVFHNHPTIWTYDSSLSPLGYSYDAGRKFMRQYVPLQLRKLWYSDGTSTGVFSDSGVYDQNKRVFKVHESVVISGGFLGVSTADYAYFAQDDSGGSDMVDTLKLVYDDLATNTDGSSVGRFINPAALVRMQQNALGNATALFYTTVFGGLVQSLITRTVLISPDIYPACTGDTIKFTAPTGAPIPVYGSYAQGYIIASEVDWDRGTMKMDILTSGL